MKTFAKGNLIQSIKHPERIAYCLSAKEFMMVRVNKEAMDYVGDKYGTWETQESQWRIFTGKVETLK